MMKNNKVIKLTEQDLRQIVKEAVNQYVDQGTFTPIGNHSLLPQKSEKEKNFETLQANEKKINSSLSKILHTLYVETSYLKKSCNFGTELNPMFIDGMKDGKLKAQAKMVQGAIAKCNELYNFLMNIKNN